MNVRAEALRPQVLGPGVRCPSALEGFRHALERVRVDPFLRLLPQGLQSRGLRLDVGRELGEDVKQEPHLEARVADRQTVALLERLLAYISESMRWPPIHVEDEPALVEGLQLERALRIDEALQDMQRRRSPSFACSTWTFRRERSTTSRS
jgi:hypothetical protein